MTRPENPLAIRFVRQLKKDKFKNSSAMLAHTGLTPNFIEIIFDDPVKINPNHKISVGKLARYLNVSDDQIYEWAGSVQPVDVTGVDLF